MKQAVKNTKTEAKKLISKSLAKINSQNFSDAIIQIRETEAFCNKEKLTEGTSISLSLLGMTQYFEDKSKFSEAIAIIHDGTQLAQISDNITAKLFNELALGNIYFCKGDNDIALLHFNNARILGMKCDEFGLLDYIITRLKQIKDGIEFQVQVQNDPLVSLVKIGRSITALTDINLLLKVIAEETKTAMQADRCTVFMLDRTNNELWSKVALGMESQEIRFPADKGLAGYVVRTGDTVNIDDAYNDDRFNSEVDKQTGYTTKTILCMPIKNNNQEIIGAFQVLNKKNGVFSKDDEDLLVAIGGSASIALENAQLFKQQEELYREQKLLFESFINTLAASIDARDKITSGHSNRVKLYSMLIAEELKLDNKEKELIEKAATLHDIGKIGIRDSVLQKEGKLTDEEYKHIQEHVQITHNILDKICMTEDFRKITEIACSHHEKYDGSGYYRHLKGEDIPYGGRILAVSDVFDAITSKRHYRDKMPIVNVIDILMKGAGNHFDKTLVYVFLQISLDKIVKVFLTENHNHLTDEDKITLSKYNLSDIYKFSTDENTINEQKEIVNLFNYYYSGNQEAK